MTAEEARGGTDCLEADLSSHRRAWPGVEEGGGGRGSDLQTAFLKAGSPRRLGQEHVA